MKPVFVFGIVALVSGCTQPTFNFRGYSELSRCDDVMNAEKSIGSVYVENITVERDERLNFHTHRMRGEYLLFPVDIFVTCHRETLFDVSYVSDALSKTDAIKFESKLVSQWSKAYEVPAFDEHHRRSDYRDGKGELLGSIPYKRVSFWCGAKTTMLIVTSLPENEEDPYWVSFGVGFSEQGRAILEC